MRNLLFVLLILLVAIPACEGDQGPIGPEGADGSPGTDGADGSGIGYTNDTPTPNWAWGGIFEEAASVTFTLAEASTVFVLATENVWGTGTACLFCVRLVFDGTPDDETMVMVDNPVASGGNNGASVSTSAMKSLGAGSHTVTLERSGCSFDKNPHLNVIVLSN